MGKTTKMVTHRVEILETLRLVVEVDLPADSTEDARQIVIDRYYDEEYVLSSADHQETEFHYLGVKNQ